MSTRSRSDDPSGPDVDADGHPLTGPLVASLLDLADRLRRLPESRLRTIAGSARSLVQLLADAAGGVDARAAARAPQLRVVPALSIFALGDQLAVTATDLAASAAGLDGTVAVWWQGGQQPLPLVVDAVRAAATDLRARL